MKPPFITLSLAVLALLGAACSSDSTGDAIGDRMASTSVDASGDPGGGCSEDVVGDDGEAVQSIVEQAFDDDDLTSVVYRVTLGGDVVAAGALGETFTGAPADQTMHFRVGNVAYAYLGTLLLLLVEDGVVRLDDTIGSLVADLDVPDADSVTLEMLLRNTSGYPDHVRTDEFADLFLDDPFRSFEMAELIDLAMATPPWYEPGTAWSYSHTGHLLLGAALEAATGEQLADLLVDRVIGPMGLADTAPALDSAVPEPVLHSYSTERGVLEDTSLWNPSWQTPRGSVITSTICDLAESAVAIGSGSLLSDESFAQLIAPVTVDLGEPPESCPPETCRAQTDDAYYGLGVRVVNGWIAQAPLFGGAGGVHAYLPDEGLAVAIQAVTGPNSEPGNPAQSIWVAIADELSPDHPVGG